MAAITKLDALAVQLKGAAMTLAQIKALDPTGPICSNAYEAVQALKARGDQITVTTDATGASLYKIDA